MPKLYFRRYVNRSGPCVPLFTSRYSLSHSSKHSVLSQKFQNWIKFEVSNPLNSGQLTCPIATFPPHAILPKKKYILESTCGSKLTEHNKNDLKCSLSSLLCIGSTYLYTAKLLPCITSHVCLDNALEISW